MAHRMSGGAPDRALFTFRCLPRQQTIGVWSGLPLKSFVLSLHRIVRWHTGHVWCVLTSLLWLLTCALFTFYCLSQSTVGTPDRCSVGSPDMSGANRTVWWIIAECLPENPKSSQFVSALAWAPDIVRCTPDSVRCATSSTIASLWSILCWVPNLISLFVYVELYAPEINDI
jgi:hypothetical protein